MITTGESARENMRAAQLASAQKRREIYGFSKSPEHRANQSLAMKGIQKSEETKARMREGQAKRRKTERITNG